MATPNQRPTGFPTHDAPQGTRYEDFVRPLSGFTSVPSIAAPSSSIVSGQNVWIQNGALQPRWRLASFSTGNPTSAAGMTGAFTHIDSKGSATLVAFSSNSLAFLGSDLQWSVSSYLSSHGSSYFASFTPPGGGNVFAATCYLPRVDENILMFSNNSDPILVWQPLTAVHSIGTQVPICRDLVNFDNRPVAWNIKLLSGTTRYVQRVQWAVAGDPEDWTGIGSGSEDLLDMQGEGTRIFADHDQMILASSAEVWRGRAVGLPYVFQFSPITKKIGMPFPRAAIQTPWGLFWLDAGYMVWNMFGEQITPVGGVVREFLARDAAEDALTSAFFSYNQIAQTVTLYYVPAPTTTYTNPNRALTLHMDTGVWTRHTFWAGANAAGINFSANIAYTVTYPTDLTFPPL